MDDPSSQLQATLNDSIKEAFALKRPILTHLNADTSWLLQLPYPPGAPRPFGRSRFNVLFDPWFRGSQSDVARFFSTQRHTTESCVQSMAELDQRLRSIESRTPERDYRPMETDYLQHFPKAEISYIDAVIISHEFTDHCNKATLLELDSDTPVFAPKRAVELMRSWRHFYSVQEIPSLSFKGFDWRRTSLNRLPTWIGISQMVSPSDSLDYHSAILLTFSASRSNSSTLLGVEELAEGIIYTPHGIHADDLGGLPAATPSISTLALLHGLHDIKLSKRKLNLGAHNGLQAQRKCQAKYWVSTHDEIKKASGLIAPWLYRNVITLEEALEAERKARGCVGDESELADVRGVTFAELTSGESLLLE